MGVLATVTAVAYVRYAYELSQNIRWSGISVGDAIGSTFAEQFKLEAKKPEEAADAARDAGEVVEGEVNVDENSQEEKSKRQTPDQKALLDLAKEAKKSAKEGKPITEEEAQILDDWANEYNVPQHHKSYTGSGKHFPGGNYSDHTHIYKVHVPYLSGGKK